MTDGNERELDFRLKLLPVPNTYQLPTPDMLYMALKCSEVKGQSYEKQMNICKESGSVAAC